MLSFKALWTLFQKKDKFMCAIVYKIQIRFNKET